jgi:methylmalonyl-CoA mutase
MTDEHAHLNLRRDFPPPSPGDWRKEAEAALKGAPFEKKLVTGTYEGIDLQPIYTLEDTRGLAHLNGMPGFAPHVRGSRAAGYLGNPWEVCQEIPCARPQELNEALKHDLQRGQTAVNLQLDRASRLGRDSDRAGSDDVGVNGTAISHLADLGAALAGIDLETYPLYIEAGFSALEMSMLLWAYLRQQGIDPAKVRGSVEADPLRFLLSEGSLPLGLTAAFDHMAEATGWAVRRAPGLKTIGVGGLAFHEAGASGVQELAFALATGLEYLERMLARDMAIDDVARSMRFNFGIGPFYFMEVAKLRAARLCWSKIIETLGGSEASRRMTIHVRTSGSNRTVYDPYVNMLRTTTGTFAAIVGGADSIHSGGFDEGFRQPDTFSRRIARNTQVILSQEAHLDRLIDPAGGSYYVETLTHEVSQRAWRLFQEIETKGGMAGALAQGFPQQEIAGVVARRTADMAKRKRVMVGINMYADVKKERLAAASSKTESAVNCRADYLKQYRKKRTPGQVESLLAQLGQPQPGGSRDIVELGAEAFLTGATLGEVSLALRADQGQPVSVERLHPYRAAQSFEDLREAAAAYKERSGSPPRLFLANMGPLSRHKARADFARSFFETGGFEVVYPAGFNTPEAAAAAAVQAAAPVVVICSGDDTYPELVPPLTRAIKEKRPGVMVVLAGYPKDQVEQHRQAGVDAFIYLGADARQILADIFRKIGVLSQ